jgi:hypothetical protein
MVTAPRIWLFGDYNQAESRVVAWRGPVPKLKKWYQEGQDVHLHVTKLVARVIQESKIRLPPRDGVAIFTRKHWDDFIKKDEEREQCKRIVHGGNYKVGIKKVALILGVDEKTAKLLVDIYFKLFPEIITNYHGWIESELKRTRTLWTPEPVRFRKVFWDQLNDDTFRAAYASYPQGTVGAMLNRIIKILSNIFREDIHEEYRDQWMAWYGAENWDRWRSLRDRGVRTPQAILWSGFDIRINAHDAGGISIPNIPDLVRWAARLWKQTGEVPIQVTPQETMVIPIEFKTGPNWGLQTEYVVN